MEKKQNSRSNQVPAKVLTSEPRKSKQGEFVVGFVIRQKILS